MLASTEIVVAAMAACSPSPDVHEVAAKGFETDAQNYESSRPSYPPAAISSLSAQLHLHPSRSRVLDVAAGSGKLTRLLVPHCLHLSALEPSAAMRSTFAAILQDIPILNGTASSMPLASASLDAVTIAQAFHWFANLASLREIHRVLVPHGRLALIWNLEDRGARNWVSALRDLYEQFEMDTPQYRLGLWREVWGTAEAKKLFSPLEGESFEHEVWCSEEMVWGRVLSKSYIACLPLHEKEHLRDRVLDLLRNAEDVERDGGGLIRYPYKTDVFWCEKRCG